MSKKLSIIGMLASVEYEAIQGTTVLGDTHNQGDAEHIHTVGYKCPVQIKVDGKLGKNDTPIYVPSAEAIANNVNVQFLPTPKNVRKEGKIEAVVTVMGTLTLGTGSKLNVIPNKFDLGSVVAI